MTGHLNKRGLLAIALLAAGAPLVACSTEPGVVLRGERFSVEIADTPDAQRLGLMFRESMPDDRGMLFIFDGEAQRGFWMKNTKISLDILYFDADRKLVYLHEDVPPCTTPECPSYASHHPSKYVLELNAGVSKRLGVQRGDVMEINLP